VKLPQILCTLLIGAGMAIPLGAQARPDTATVAQLPSVELPRDLARVLTDYETEWRRGGGAVAQLFTEDGFVLSGGRPPIKGRAAIAEHYGSGGGGPLSLRAIAYAAEGGVAYIIGGYTTERGAPDIGKFTLTLRKRPDGRWMIVSDMDSPNRRPQQRAP
jgi:ketosteroid isomerase-like protein